jgi:small-conductance mechanosensitive channel
MPKSTGKVAMQNQKQLVIALIVIITIVFIGISLSDPNTVIGIITIPIGAVFGYITVKNNQRKEKRSWALKDAGIFALFEILIGIPVLIVGLVIYFLTGLNILGWVIDIVIFLVIAYLYYMRTK